MPTYTLRGVEVDFPYEAYDCQVREERTAREERREREAGRGPIRSRILSPLTPTITPHPLLSSLSPPVPAVPTHPSSPT